MRAHLWILPLLMVCTVNAQAQERTQQRPEDAAAIRAHIESIFRAFIDKDVPALARTHSEDWRGFLDGSTRVIRDREGYMRATTGAASGKPGTGMIGYRITDFDVVFHGPVVGVATFVAEVDSKSGDRVETSKLNIVDTYSKESGEWIQVASGTANSPTTIEARMAANASLPEVARVKLLETREAVWKAWFSGDIPSLEALLPEELITLEPGKNGWGTRATVIEAARKFAQGGGKLVKIEFPRTEMQVYGRAVIIYTTYTFEASSSAGTQRESGKATEIFVFRNGKWINSGWQLAPDRAQP
jgi:hypothetical protein